MGTDTRNTRNPIAERHSKLRYAGLLLTFSLAISPRVILAQLNCGITQQVTFAAAGRSFGSSISADGTRVAFLSDRDLTGGNSDGNEEVFLFDATTQAFSQITNSAGSSNGNPSISADGTRIAFASTGDPTGDNTDGNSEIFVFFAATNTIRQFTRTTTGGSSQPSMSADGRRIAFSSSSDLTPWIDPVPGGGNFDGNVEIFLADVDTGAITQITYTEGISLEFQDPVENIQPSISGDGRRIAFASTADLMPPWNEDGNHEIFLWDASAGFTQGTNTHHVSMFQGCFEPSISADGRRVAFTIGWSYNSGSAVVVADTVTHELFIPPNQDQPAAIGSQNPSISGDGTRVAFESTFDLTGENPDHNFEIFVFDTPAETLSQITVATEGGSISPSIRSDGRGVAFESSSDLTGGNADGSVEIFLAECDAAGPVTVVIGGCDSGVPNLEIPGGGMISDRLVQCAINARNHGAFVRCVTHVTDDLKKAAIITGAQKAAIQSCAAKAKIP